VSVLLEKVDAGSELAALPLRSAEFHHVPEAAPTLCTSACGVVTVTDATAYASGSVVSVDG
jgi:hypothetical protein